MTTAPWDRRSPEEHRRVAERALAQWLPAATSFSAYWADRAREMGVESGSLSSPDDLARFAPVREADVRAAGGPGAPGLLMRPTQAQVRARAASSTLFGIGRRLRRDGREGERRAVLEEYKPVHVHRGGVDDDLAIAYSRTDLDRMHRCGARAARVLGLDDADYLVSAVPAGPRLDFWGIYHLALGASILALHPRGSNDELDRVVDSFPLVPATVVAVRLDEAVQLAALLVEHDVEAPRVHTVVTVGPPPDDQTRDAIREAWRAAGATESDLVVRALFAPPEARTLWAEPRPEPTGLVTFPDLEWLEVVDGLTGEVSDDGGDLTVTTMGWHGTALVRFQTGTYVEGIDRTPCPASGITAPRVVGPVVERAWQPDVTDAAGQVGHFDFRTAGALLAHVPGIEAWRIELHGPTAEDPYDGALIEVAGEVDPGDLEEVAAQIERDAGLAPYEIAVEPDPATIDDRIEEAGSPFVDMR